MPHTVDELLGMKREELEGLFRSVNNPGPIPDGFGKGTALLAPGPLEKDVAKFINKWIWKGKVFNRQKGTLLNVVFGVIEAFKARVSTDHSIDDPPNQSIVLDYSHDNNDLVRFVRDEIRQISPNLYLGKVYFGTPESETALGYFCLQFGTKSRPKKTR